MYEYKKLQNPKNSKIGKKNFDASIKLNNRLIK